MIMTSYHVGLDLRQASDYTAIAIVEKTGDTGDKDAALRVRHLQRFALGTTYPAIVEAVAGIVASLPDGARLAVDATGVGRPVVDLLRTAGLKPIAVTVTGGDAVTHEGQNWKIPKSELVAGVQVALQQGRLQIASGLPDAATLTHELLNFKVTIDPKTAHDSYGAWRESIHDELVFAVGLAVWSADKFGGGNRFYVVSGRRRW